MIGIEPHEKPERPLVTHQDLRDLQASYQAAERGKKPIAGNRLQSLFLRAVTEAHAVNDLEGLQCLLKRFIAEGDPRSIYPKIATKLTGKLNTFKRSARNTKETDQSFLSVAPYPPQTRATS